jgi:hypothetical protein
VAESDIIQWYFITSLFITYMKKIASYVAILAVLVVLLAAASLFLGGSNARTPVHAATTCPDGSAVCLDGWAWSSDIGWVSFNSADDSGTSATYDVAVASNGALSGYAWSSNVGWISFNSSDIQASPSCSGTLSPSIDTNTGAIVGWARVVSEEGRSDGWDGCVELSGTNHLSPDFSGAGGSSAQGLTYASSTNAITGYGWGGNVIGWLSPFNITCPNCVATLNDLVFVGIDSGVGSGGTGAQSQNLVFTLPSATGSVSVPVQWTINSAKNVQIASPSGATGVSTDWGVNSGSTVTASGQSLSANGSDSITFNSAGTKILELSYKLGSTHKTQEVTVVINPYAAPINTCKRPANVVLPACGATDSGTATTVTQCQIPAPECEYQCLSGYHPENGMCVKSTIQEI